MTKQDLLIEVRDLKTYFYLREGVVKAVDGANFSITRGKTTGIVGESGCGKSVTAQSIMQIVPRPGRIVGGEITLWPGGYSPPSPPILGGAGANHPPEAGGEGGRPESGGKGGRPVKITDLDPQGAEMRDLRGSAMGMIFQEPMSSFSPVHTIGDQLSETVLLHQSVSKDTAKGKVLEMMGYVGIANPERNFAAYPHQLSGGMRQRAMIAMALMLRPSLLIADEPTTALDVTTEAQILRLMRRLQAELGMAIMFITHDLGVIAEMADDVVVMYLGRVVEEAEVDAIFHDPKHPYLRALLRSIPRIGAKTEKRLAAIEGMVPNPLALPSGCPFHTRCPEIIPGLCDSVVPGYTAFGSRHTVACHLYGQEGR
jgi:peptide/nickel transport system ATP-binding protein